MLRKWWSTVRGLLEQLRRDFAVGDPVRNRPQHLELLTRQLIQAVRFTFAGSFTSGAKLTASALSPQDGA